MICSRVISMIDSTTETLLSLADAAGTLPRRRKGRKPHVSTLHRWATSGFKGVVLETIQVGGTKCTSEEALQRFFEACSTPRSASPPATATAGTPPVRRSTARRQRDATAAAKELERLGA